MTLPITLPKDEYRILENLAQQGHSLNYLLSNQLIVQSTSEPIIPSTLVFNKMDSTLTSSPITEARIREEHEIIAELFDAIDQRYRKTSDLVLELAERMNDNRTCKPNQICMSIKDKLRDKIKAGKITGRWIEKILSPHYTRKYRSKTSLFSSENKGKQHLTPVESKIDAGPFKKRFDVNNHEAIAELSNLSDEALHIPQGELDWGKIWPRIFASHKIPDTQIEFSIPANKFVSVIMAMKNSKNKIHLVLEGGIFKYPYSDSLEDRVIPLPLANT